MVVAQADDESAFAGAKQDLSRKTSRTRCIDRSSQIPVLEQQHRDQHRHAAVEKTI